jgi:hypothetical protein
MAGEFFHGDIKKKKPRLRSSFHNLKVPSCRRERCNVISSPTGLPLNETSRMGTLEEASPGRGVSWTSHPLEEASLGRAIPWTSRPLDEPSLGRAVPWTSRPLDEPSRWRGLPGMMRPLAIGPETLGQTVFMLGIPMWSRKRRSGGRIVQGMLCSRVAASKGRIDKGRYCPWDGTSETVWLETHWSDTLYHVINRTDRQEGSFYHPQKS